MITPILERLILENKAVYKTFNHGISAVGTIPNPQQRTLIVTDITFNLMFGSKEDKQGLFFKDGSVFLDYIKNKLPMYHGLKLTAGSKVLDYTYRTNFKAFKNPEGKEVFVYPDGIQQNDCYFTTNENIHIDIFQQLNFDGSNVGPLAGFLPDFSKEKPLRSGYSTNSNPPSDRAIFPFLIGTPGDPHSSVYSPLGVRDPQDYAGANPNYINQFLCLYPLPITGFQDNNLSGITPLVTFGYVELLERYSTKYGSTG